MQPQIDNLIWIHEILASGTTQQRWKDFDVFAYEREGGPRLLVALNNDPNWPHTIQVATGFGANVHLKDYTGHGGDVFTDGGGGVTVQVPANANGLGYVCYSRVGQDRPLPTTTHAVTQDFEGAADLDILPAMNGKTVNVGRIFCAASTRVTAVLTIDQTGWTAASQIVIALEFPDRTQQISTMTSGPPANEGLKTTTTTEGFYTLQLTASGMPVATIGAAYKLSVTYTAPQEFLAANPVASPSVAGEWAPEFDLKNVAIHAHLLPTGKVLYWGRRTAAGSLVFATLNDHHCDTYLWDPATGLSIPTKNSPVLPDGTTVNLFCAGHALLADGRVMVVGGHLFDSQGANQSCIYDPATDEWTAQTPMNDGRWYPSALALPDGGLLAISGSFATGALQPPPNANQVNPTPQVWRNGSWSSLTNFDNTLDAKLGLKIPALPLFPRLHVEPKQGHVFMSGSLGTSFFLDPNGGDWSLGPIRDAANRDYAPSVMYESGKVIFIGGGTDDKTQLPTNLAETIDLNEATPQWKPTAAMHFRRRQHNATVLPDGTVLVTGGTQGKDFNDVDDPGATVHQAELWDPTTGTWTILAEEEVDRCYHSTAVLLPDGRVLSAGGGEYAPTNNVANPAKDTHADAQLFSPPYLFKGQRPMIISAPIEASYAQAFEVTVGAGDTIAKVSWVRLTSVTHSCNQNQLLNFLTFAQASDKITVTAPTSANIAPPGHYLLFVLNAQGVPSIGHIVHISDKSVGALVHNAAFALLRGGSTQKVAVPEALDIAAARQTGKFPVIVGVTPTCPYGISACWAGAYDGLNQITGVDKVWPRPDSVDSIAFVFLKEDILPDIEVWRAEFAAAANGSYVLRGIELTLDGTVSESNGLLTLAGNATRPEVVLAPLQGADKVQWNIDTWENWPMSPDEETAYERLSKKLGQAVAGATVEVAGPLKKNGKDFYMEVRTAAINAVAV